MARNKMRNLIFLILLIIALAVAAVRLWKTEEQWLGAGFGLLAIVGTLSLAWAGLMFLVAR
jgi:hypothetical protein